MGQLPNFVTSFEVLEHVEPEMMIRMLKHMQLLTTPDARFFISTPCWNRTDCAANHVNEMLYEALGSVFERVGFQVLHTYGTFASIRDYEHLLGDSNVGQYPKIRSLRSTFQELREYYDTNFLSCIFAPLFPAQSRNALWELKKVVEGSNYTKKFPKIEDITKPWGSSKNWEEMAI
jgi:hypothetical protein